MPSQFSLPPAPNAPVAGREGVREHGRRRPSPGSSAAIVTQCSSLPKPCAAFARRSSARSRRSSTGSSSSGFINALRTNATRHDTNALRCSVLLGHRFGRTPCSRRPAAAACRSRRVQERDVGSARRALAAAAHGHDAAVRPQKTVIALVERAPALLDDRARHRRRRRRRRRRACAYGAPLSPWSAGRCAPRPTGTRDFPSLAARRSRTAALRPP